MAELKYGADFDVTKLLDPDVIANPYPYYALLRARPPQFGLLDYPPGTVPGVDQPNPAWVFTRYEDVQGVMKNHDAFSSRDPMQEASEAPTLMLVNHDRPRHTLLRNIAKKAFTPKRVGTDIAPLVTQTISEMVNGLIDNDIDFMQEVAGVLPSVVMTFLIGTPREDYPKLVRWANAFMVSSDFTPEERQQCNIELFTYYSTKVAECYAAIERGDEVPDTLMAAFIRAEDEGQHLTKEEVVLFCITLVVAGAETTTYLLGNLVATLQEEPEFFDLLKRDRTQVRPFIEESLRRDGPPQRLFRVATQDIEHGGVQIKQGDWVAFFMAAANRDPDMFEQPDKFILNRPNIGRHVTFGHGIHHCLGSSVARMEAEKMLEVILDNCSGIDAGSKPKQRQRGGLLTFGLQSLPVVLKS
ncbi:cytochrome P450 [Oceanococcus atlanticus]|uniref:Cytochrome P450 n=1 Tax=Oceanococcus atlanticus TaxID=1317117 RepID=A0A1Y1SEY7_9GAMM|nr:cytochrome P450 [Oceanococcus atlanticus]ORE88227.1 cytochrome P450 [Oceanococcus atlanticus]RZO85680.1 MAG: cytochrome P450 [Oceanococcus sp.]